MIRVVMYVWCCVVFGAVWCGTPSCGVTWSVRVAVVADVVDGGVVFCGGLVVCVRVCVHVCLRACVCVCCVACVFV